MDNMIRSEAIARAMAESLPAVAALVTDGSPVSRIGDDCVMLYPWLSCRPVLPPKITARHTEKIGAVLARMHKAGASLLVSGAIPPAAPDSPVSVRIWEEEYEAAAASSPDAPWLAPLRDALPLLDRLEIKACAAAPSLPITVLSHRDLDPKNVLWEGGSPRIIDWESAGETNPAVELLEALLAWTDDGQGGLDEPRLDAMLTAYRENRTMENEPWDAVFDASFRGPLDWLAYNIRRASGIGTSGDSERHVGESEVQKTLRALARRRDELAEVRRWLEG